MDFSKIREDEHEQEELTQDPAGKPGCLLRATRVALVALLVLLLLAGLAPTLLSSAAGREWALRKINASVAPAEVAVEQWSLGWFRAPVLDKVCYTDVAKGVDFKAEQVVFDRGLLRLLPIGALNLGRVTVKKPDIVATLARGAPPPAVAVAGTGAKPSKAVLPIAGMSGTLVLENGQLTVNGAGAHGFSAQQLNAEVTVPSWREPVGVAFQASLGNGTVALDGRLASLEALTLKQGGTAETLTLKLANVNLAAFSPLLQQFSDGVWFDSGEANGTLTFSVASASQFGLAGSMMVSGLSIANAKRAPSPKTDVVLVADVDCTEGKADIRQFALQSPWVNAEAKGTLAFGTKETRMLGAVDVLAVSDLPALVRDFGTVLGFSPAFDMQAGSVKMGFTIHAREDAVGVDAALLMEGLGMRFENEPLVLKPEPSFLLKAVLPYDRMPEIVEMKLRAPFAELDASGRLDNAQMKGFLNLTMFSRDFRRVFKSLPLMVGDIKLDASTQPGSNGRIPFAATLNAKDLVAEFKPGARLVVPQGVLKASGFLAEEEKRFSEFYDAAFDLTMDGGNASGTFSHLAFARADVPMPFQLRGFSMKSEFALASLRWLIGGFLSEGLRAKAAGWDGQVFLNATAEIANGVTRARLDTAGQHLHTKDASTNITVHIPDVRLSSVITQERADGEIHAGTDLIASVALFRDKKAVFAENDVKLKADLRIAPDFERVQAKTLTFSSDLLGFQGSVDATALKSRCVVAAQGKLTVDCERVTHLLDAQGFDERMQWTLTGRAARDFKFKAPLAGGLDTLFAEGEMDAAVFIQSFKGMGFDAGASDLSMKLSRGVMKVAYTPPLNNGKLKCVPEFAFERGNLTCVLPPKTRLLENVQVTQGVMDYWLINVFPVFKGSIVQDGGATLDIASFKYVNGSTTPDKGLSADSTLSLKNPRLVLGPVMRDLLALMKIKNTAWQTGQMSIHTVIKDGRLHIDPIKVEIEKQPMTFSGWTTLNGDINYLVEVPLTERLLGKNASFSLVGKTVQLPVTGTLTSPKVDTRALVKALASVVTEAVVEEATDRVNEFLDKLRKELQK